MKNCIILHGNSTPILVIPLYVCTGKVKANQEKQYKSKYYQDISSSLIMVSEAIKSESENLAIQTLDIVYTI